MMYDEKRKSQKQGKIMLLAVRSLIDKLFRLNRQAVTHGDIGIDATYFLLWKNMFLF